MQSKKEVVDELLQAQKSQLNRTGGFEKLEQMRKERDKEFFSLLPTFNYDSVDEEDYDFDDLHLKDSDSEPDGGLINILSFLKPPEANRVEYPKSDNEGDFTSMITGLFKK